MEDLGTWIFVIGWGLGSVALGATFIIIGAWKDEGGA